MKKKSKKIEETSNLLQITKKLRKHQLLFLYENLSSNAKNLLCELMFNILYNKNCLCLSKYQTCKLKRILKPHQKDMEYIARRSNSEKKKEKIIKKQIGSGVLTSAISFLAPILANIVASNLK